MAVILGTTSPTAGIHYQKATQRQIVKASSGTLVMFANVTNDLKYKTSDDNGATWDASWTDIFTLGTYMYSVDAHIDENDDIHLVYYTLYFNSRVYYRKLTWSSGDSWSLGSAVLVSATVTNYSPKFAIRSNGDYWVATRYNTYYSDDSGSTWNNVASPVSSSNCTSIFPKGSDMWLISQQGGGLYYYVYTSSWGSSNTIVSSGITNDAEGLGVVKISDSNIWCAGRTSSGIKIYQYTTSWDSGTLLSNNATDELPALTNLANNPICTWRDYDGSQYDIAYREYNGSSWESQVDLTNTSEDDFRVTTVDNDLTYLYVTWFAGNSAPYDITFDKVTIAPVTETLTVTENFTFADTQVLSVDMTVTENFTFSDESDPRETQQLAVNENFTFDDAVQSFVNTSANESFTFDDSVTIKPDLAKLTINENFDFSDEVISFVSVSASFGTGIAWFNPLFFVTDEDPAKIIKVDITDPASPVSTSATLTGAKNAKAIAYNNVNGYLYVACADGKVVKVDSTDITTQTIIDLSDTDDLETIDTLASFGLTYTSTENAIGELYLIDERETKAMDSDFTCLSPVETIGHFQFDLVDLVKIDSNLHAIGVNSYIMNCDFKCITNVINEIDPIARNDFEVYIDSVILEDTDIDLSSIIINHSIGEKSNTVFTLTRKHDDLNTTLSGNTVTITSQNVVRVDIDGRTEFSGRVANLDCLYATSDDQVTITAIGDEKNNSFNNVTLSLPSIDSALTLYDVLIQNPQIYNPYLDPNDENPVRYNGVRVNLGEETRQSVSRVTYLGSQSDTAEEILDGSFIIDQNSEYFWGSITARKFGDIAIGQTSAETFFYIGTSLSPVTESLWTLDGVGYRKQRQRDDIVTTLGEYTVGSAPFKEVTTRNGRLITVGKWSDEDDGLYVIQDAGYNFEDYAKKVADLEYEKLLNINGDLFPETSATVELTIDAYYYYGILLLTRVNIDNTTSSDIFNNSNGFPVGVKSITISSGEMKVSLQADNQKSPTELEDIDGQFPDDEDPEYNTPEARSRISAKTDMKTRLKVE